MTDYFHGYSKNVATGGIDVQSVSVLDTGNGQPTAGPVKTQHYQGELPDQTAFESFLVRAIGVQRDDGLVKLAIANSPPQRPARAPNTQAATSTPQPEAKPPHSEARDLPIGVQSANKNAEESSQMGHIPDNAQGRSLEAPEGAHTSKAIDHAPSTSIPSTTGTPGTSSAPSSSNVSGNAGSSPTSGTAGNPSSLGSSGS